MHDCNDYGKCSKHIRHKHVFDGSMTLIDAHALLVNCVNTNQCTIDRMVRIGFEVTYEVTHHYPLAIVV